VRTLTGAALLAVATSAGAHHSIAGMYDASRNSTLDGVVAEFQFINPHLDRSADGFGYEQVGTRPSLRAPARR